MRNAYKVWLESLQGTCHAEEVQDKTILKLILGKLRLWMGMYWMNMSQHRDS